MFSNEKLTFFSDFCKVIPMKNLFDKVLLEDHFYSFLSYKNVFNEVEKHFIVITAVFYRNCMTMR